MKRVFNFLCGCFMMAALVPFMVSCEEFNSGGGSNTGGELFEGTIILEQGIASSARTIIKSDEAWFASNNNTWFSVSPLKGEPGETEIGIVSMSANEDIYERVGYFTVNTEKYYVVQKGIETTVIKKDEILAVPGQEEVQIPFNSTRPSDKMNVTSDVDWVEFLRIEKTKEPKLLADSVTYSDYYEAVIVLSIKEQNTSDASRRGNVNIKVGDHTFTTAIIQLGSAVGEVDFLKNFYKSSVYIKTTGTWCANCPIMSYQLHDVEDKYPDNFYVVNEYNNSGALTWSGGEDIEAHYGCTSFPTGYFNGYAKVDNYGGGAVTTATEKLIQEAIELYPANVAIAAYSSIVNDKIQLDVKLAAKASNEYKLTIYILEDGIVAQQAGSNEGDEYVHNDILRGTLTANHHEGGDAIKLPIGEIVTERFEANVPSDVVDKNNMEILVYVTYVGGPEANTVVEKPVTYKNYGFVIDNAVKISAADGKADFRYEE